MYIRVGARRSSRPKSRPVSAVADQNPDRKPSSDYMALFVGRRPGLTGSQIFVPAQCLSATLPDIPPNRPKQLSAGGTLALSTRATPAKTVLSARRSTLRTKLVDPQIEGSSRSRSKRGPPQNAAPPSGAHSHSVTPLPVRATASARSHPVRTKSFSARTTLPSILARRSCARSITHRC